MLADVTPARRPVPRSAAALLLAFLAAAPARADDRPGAPARPVAEPIEVRVARLLGEVASDDFSVREKARRSLQALGPASRAALEARREDPDPEVRRTVLALLDAFGSAGADPLGAGPVADLASLGLVTASGSGALADVLRLWESAQGGRFRHLPAPATATVRLEAKARPWFEALDDLLAQGGVELRDGFDQAGGAEVVARRGDGTAPPAAFAGPLKLQVDSVTSVRSFRVPGPRSYALGLRLFWAPDVQVVGVGLPALVRAADRAGRPFASRPAGSDASTVRSVGSSRRATDLTLTVETGDPATEEALASAEVQVRLRIRHGREEARFEDLGALPATRTASRARGAEGKPGRVTLEEFGPDADHPGWWVGRLTASLPPGVAAESVVPALESTDGSVRALFDYGTRSVGSDGVVGLTVRAAGLPPGVAPKALVVSWLAREGQGAVAFVLKDVPLR
jgi:hypothetical protein